MYPLISVSVLLIVLVFQINCEKLKCQMVPFETKEGLMGHCCVFLKNSNQTGVEDITDQISTETMKKFSAGKFEDQEAVSFPKDSIEDNKEHKRPVHGKTAEDNSDPRKPPANDNRNGSLPERRAQQNNSAPTNGTANPKIIGFAINRNAVDIPENCPDGSEKDHSGNCVKEF